MATQVAGKVRRPAESLGAQRAGVGPQARVAQPVPGEVVGEAEEAATGGAGQGCPRGSSAPPATATASPTASPTAPASPTVRWAALGRWRGLRIHACGEKGERWGRAEIKGGVLGVAERNRQTEAGMERQRVRYSTRERGHREMRDKDERHREAEMRDGETSGEREIRNIEGNRDRKRQREETHRSKMQRQRNRMVTGW